MSHPYTRRWRNAREVFLKRNPLCVYCQRKGIVTPACVVDHIIPHKLNGELFWNTANWQSLCKHCHDSLKQSEERVGYSREIGVDGWPIDDRHPMNRQENE